MAIRFNTQAVHEVMVALSFDKDYKTGYNWVTGHPLWRKNIMGSIPEKAIELFAYEVFGYGDSPHKDEFFDYVREFAVVE